LAIWVALIAFWVRYYPIAPGHDSFAYALNYAHAKGLVFGRDAAFTYGPLAFLAIPMHVGSNLGLGILFQVAVWLCFSAVCGWVILARKTPLGRSLAFGAGLLLSTGLFHEFGYAGPDMFLVCLGLLLLGSAAGSTRAAVWFAGACAVAAAVFFIKVSTSLGLISALAVFTAATLLAGGREGRRYLLCLASLPLLVLLAHVVMFASPSALWGYVHAALELSSGYSVTMSAGDSNGLRTALALMAAWIVMTALLYGRRANSWPLALACVGLLFFEFKHAYVRESGHVEIFFLFIPFLCGWLILFTEFRKHNGWYIAASLGLIAALWYARDAHRLAGLSNPLAWLPNRSVYSGLLDYSGLARRLDSATGAAMAAQRLPPELLARIGRASMAGFPMECAFAAVNPVDMRLFPIFQWYMAYTPHLDRRNAAFLEDARTAPAFLVFDWDFVDDRHPLLDAPATLSMLSRHYEFDGMYGVHMLLRRRTRPRFGAWRLLESRQLSLQQPVRIPASSSPLSARIHLAWNLKGRLLKFFFRVPEVRLVASSAAGRGLDVRVPSEVLENGLPLNFLPFDLEAMRSFFAGEVLHDRAETVLIGGAGAGYLDPSVCVEIYEARDLALPFAPPQAPDFRSLQLRGELGSAWIEMLNETGASAFSVVTVPNKRGYLRVRGWAAVEGKPAGGVVVALDGKPHPAEYGAPRPDVQTLLHSPDALRTGFDWSVPAWDLGRSWHELTLKILTPDRKGYYEGARRLRFRME